MSLPNFIVVGAGRCGTTSLHHRLSQHPQIFMTPEKSPNYFIPHGDIPVGEVTALRDMARHWVSTREAYEALFDGAKDEIAIGEVSPVYLQTTQSPALIHALCPDAKIIAILRHPVERAYAHFLGRRRDGLEIRKTFAEVAQTEAGNDFPDQIAFGHYLGCGRYHHFLRGFYDLFPPQRIKVFFYDDLVSAPQTLMAELFAFLEVDSSFTPDEHYRNRSGDITNPITRYLWVNTVRLRTWLRPHLPLAMRDWVFDVIGATLSKPELDADLRTRLAGLFEADLQQLEVLLDRDLSRWRT